MSFFFLFLSNHIDQINSNISHCLAVYSEDTECVGFAWIGSEDQKVVAGTMKQLQLIDFGGRNAGFLQMQDVVTAIRHMIIKFSKMVFVEGAPKSSILLSLGSFLEYSAASATRVAASPVSGDDDFNFFLFMKNISIWVCNLISCGWFYVITWIFFWLNVAVI